MLPVRCYTCNALLADVFPAFQQWRMDGGTTREFVDARGYHRPCCRIAFLCHVDSVDHLKTYSNDDATLDDAGTRLLRRVEASRTVPCADDAQ